MAFKALAQFSGVAVCLEYVRGDFKVSNTPLKDQGESFREERCTGCLFSAAFKMFTYSQPLLFDDHPTAEIFDWHHFLFNHPIVEAILPSL